MATYQVAVADKVGLADTSTAGGLYIGVLTSVIAIHDTHVFFKGASVELVSILRVQDATTVRMRRAVTIAGGFKLRSVLGVNAVYNRRIDGGSLHLQDLFGFQHAAAITQAMRFGARAQAALGLSMSETLSLVQRQARKLILNAVLRQGLDLHAILKSGQGASLVEAVRFTERMTRVYCAAAEADDVLRIEDSVDIALQVVVVVNDVVALDDATVLRMIFAGELVDGIDFTLGVAESGGGITTWAMNTRTGAVTEYTDFAFTSFAPFGNSYLGVGKDGLYELLGDDDAGSPIVADMISGLAQMTGSQLGSFKAAYVAMRGEGEFYLRLTADESRSTTYRVLVQPLRTARVDMGKGWRARYFSFQLVSSGQDFDLDELTFLPIAATRRI